MTTPSTSAQGPVLNPLALEALENNQRQLDMDGVEVGVSRQALDEVLAAYKAAVERINRATDAEIGGIHRSFAASPSPAASPASPSGVREAVRLALEWDENRNYLMPYRVRDKLRASLASDATPAPTSGSEDGGETVQSECGFPFCSCAKRGICAHAKEGQTNG